MLGMRRTTSASHIMEGTGEARSHHTRTMTDASDGHSVDRLKWLKRHFDRTVQSNDEVIGGYLVKASFGKWNKTHWNHRWFMFNKSKGLLYYYKRKPKEGLAAKSIDERYVLAMMVEIQA